MNCAMLAALDAETPAAQQALSQVPDWFETWEQAFSRFRPASELCRLNARLGEWVSVSADLFAVLSAAQQAYELTDGWVTPSVLDALEAAGYDRSFDAAGMSAARAPVPAGLPPQLDPVRRRAHLGARLDLGGIAKGWCAQQAMHRLAEHAATLMDAGGDIAISGPRGDGSAWPVGIAHPLNDAEDIALLVLREPCGIATSGRDYRRWGRGQHHLLDPHTGAPAQTTVLSVTAIAPSVLEAEAAAKRVLLQGAEPGLAWLARQVGFEALLVLEDGNAHASPGFMQHVWR